MKKIIAFLLCIFAGAAQAQQVQLEWGFLAGSPNQLQFRSGSTWYPIGTFDGTNFTPHFGAGTTCGAHTWFSAVSTVGALTCTQPAFSDISGQATLAQLPTMGTNTVLANVTAVSATPTAFSMPSCSGSTNALNWTANTGFTCASALSIAFPVTVSGSVTSGGVPYFNSTTQMSSSALLAANALVLGGGAGGAPATLGSLGTTTTVLHGNAAGAPSFAAVSLTADVSGRLPFANLTQGATNTVLANSTNATADFAAFSMPSCSAATNALTWTTNSGFTCNTAINATTFAEGTIRVKRLANPSFEVSTWAAFDSNGTKICDTSVPLSTTTGCLAEANAAAFSYVLGNTSPGYDMEVYGGADPAPNGTKYSGAAVLIPMTTAWTTKPMQGGRIVGHGLTVLCTLIIDSVEYGTISFEGSQVLPCAGGDPVYGLIFKPINPSPYDLIKAIGPGHVFFQSVNGGFHFDFSVSTGGVAWADVHVNELNFIGITSNACVFKIDTATAGANNTDNHIQIDFLHGMTTTGNTAACIGTAFESGGNHNANNIYDMGILGSGIAYNGVDTWGHDDQWKLRFGDGGHANYLIKFESGSCRNHVDITTDVMPATPVVDNSGCTGVNANVVTLNGYTSSGSAACRNVTPAGTGADVTEDTLQTCTLPASSLTTTGWRLHITAGGSFGADANNKTIKFYFGAQAYTSGVLTSNGVNWLFTGDVWRTGANAQSFLGTLQAGVSLPGVGVNTLTQTETGAITIKMTGQNGTAVANDITCTSMFVDVIP